MIFATIKGMTAVVKKMLAQGADMRSATPQGGTPLVLASEYGHNELVSLLLQEVHPFETSAVGRASKSSRIIQRVPRETIHNRKFSPDIGAGIGRIQNPSPPANPPKTPHLCSSAPMHAICERERVIWLAAARFHNLR